MNDTELLLLGWAQMVALEFLSAESEYLIAKQQIESALNKQFGVTDISLTSRMLDVYRVVYTMNGDTKEAVFEADDVESIFE